MHPLELNWVRHLRQLAGELQANHDVGMASVLYHVAALLELRSGLRQALEDATQAATNEAATSAALTAEELKLVALTLSECAADESNVQMHRLALKCLTLANEAAR